MIRKLPPVVKNGRIEPDIGRSPYTIKILTKD